MIRSPLVALGALLALATPARGDYLVETAASYGTMQTTGAQGVTVVNYSDGLLLAGNDARSGGLLDVAGAKFGVRSVLASGLTITGASLTFTVLSDFGVGGGSPPSTLGLTVASSASAATSLADFAATPGTSNAGTVLASLPFPLGGAVGTITVDVTGLISSIYRSGALDAFLRFDDLTRQTTVTLAPYFSFPGVGAAPTLTIQFTPAATAVPEPASAALAVVGLGLIAAARGGRRCPAARPLSSPAGSSPRTAPGRRRRFPG